MSETSTESLDEAFPKTAHEMASAYESAGDAMVNDVAPDDSAPSSALPDDTVPSETATLPNSAAPVETATPPDNAAPGETQPDNSAPMTPRGPPPSREAPQPLSHMNLQNSLRLRMKVWTDPSTLKRYLMSTGFMRDLVNGQPVTDVMYAYAMRDDDTRVVVLTAAAWNSLPFFYFQEDGHAPRAAAQPMDAIP